MGRQLRRGAARAVTRMNCKKRTGVHAESWMRLSRTCRNMTYAGWLPGRGGRHATSLSLFRACSSRHSGAGHDVRAILAGLTACRQRSQCSASATSRVWPCGGFYWWSSCSTRRYEFLCLVAVEVDGAKIAIYQPQLESWNGNVLDAYSAVTVKTAGTDTINDGSIWFTARTEVDKVDRILTL